MITLLLALTLLIMTACANTETATNYGSDKNFFKEHNIETVELATSDGKSRVLLVPAWQGRVMTSTTGGDNGRSYGWINYKFIASGEVNPQFNSFGGEERFWIGPEGGPFSWFFKPGEEQIYANWLVPKVIDTEAFELIVSSSDSAVLKRRAILENASGNTFEMGLSRTVRIEDPSAVLGLDGGLPAGINALAYSTSNSITNEGQTNWEKVSGMPSVWLLGCFTPSPTTTVFIPYNRDCKGRIVKDDYFGELPNDRISVRDGFVFFKIDGAFRSKIGLPQDSATGLVGSYDSANRVLNILKYNRQEGPCDYINSQWGVQNDNFGGDVVNSYNDGPTETGTIMGPFYEIETSSPAANLAPGQTLTHTQYTIHMEGDSKALDAVARKVFGISLQDIHL